MDHSSEQQQEIETLSYIYQPDELLIMDESKVKIKVKCDDPDLENQLEEVGEEEGDDEEEEEEGEEDESAKVLFTLTVCMPATYPEVEPELELSSAYLLAEEIDSLVQSAMAQCRDCLGDAMIYNICSFVKEQAEETIRNRIAREAREVEEEKEKQEQEEARKYQGTRVTSESFLKWQQGFLEEAKHALKSGKPLIKAFEAALAVEKLINTSNKLTGRQLFEKGDLSLLNSDAQFGEGSTVEVDAKLLHGLKDMNLLAPGDDEEEENLVLAGFSPDD